MSLEQMVRFHCHFSEADRAVREQRFLEKRQEEQVDFEQKIASTMAAYPKLTRETARLVVLVEKESHPNYSASTEFKEWYATLKVEQ